MHGMIDVICMIDEELKDRKLPPMKPQYGAWSLGGNHFVRLDEGGNLQMVEERSDGFQPLGPPLSLPAHPRWARSFAQDVAELVPSITP